MCRGEHTDKPDCKQNLGGQDNEEVRGGSTEAVFVSPQCQRNCPEKGQQSKGSEMGRIKEGASLSVGEWG